MRLTPILLILFLALAALSSCSSGDDDDSGGAASDAASSDDTTDDDTVGQGWDGVGISSANAPDEYSVRVTFTSDPGADTAGAPAIYSLDSDHGALAVTGVEYDASSATATLATDRQKLGVDYTLTVTPAGAKSAALTASFPSADTATLWADDFETQAYYTVTANRAVVGEKCVIYLEQGFQVADADQTVAIFDEQIYPVETALFTTPGDMDGNGKILILGLNGHGWYGGYFNPVNSLSDTDTWDWWKLHSNEMEMLYVAAEGGTLNPVNVVAHEFQHLLYNARHGIQDEYWSYHDEGLAETAVHAVFGVNDYSMNYYLADPYGIIANGLSLVDWVYSQYENYALAYMWWIYAASRMGGIDSLHDIFELPTGNPDEVDALTQSRLGESMTGVLFNNRIACQALKPSGVYGYNGLLSPPATPAAVAAGTTSLDLEPYAGAYFRLDQNSIPYPDTQGADIVYAGVNAMGDVDLDAPFDVTGGALVVFNTDSTFAAFPTQHSGPDLPAVGQMRALFTPDISPAWTDPPPLYPDQPELLQAWKARRLEQMGK